VVVLALHSSRGSGVVTVAPPAGGNGGGARAVGGEFLGLSFEAAELAEVAHDGSRGDLVALLRSLGPGVMRFGGTTADTQVAWRRGRAPLPPWATSSVTPQDLHALGQLARATGWRVMLTVNLGHFDPAAAADEARSARRALGGALRAIEIGNEPESFPGHRLRARTWNIAAYLAQVDAYRRAIAAAAPGLSLAGPDAVNPRSGRRWLIAEAALRPALLTVHQYPLGRCGKIVPTVADLLDPALGRPESSALRRLRTLARRTGIPVRVDEANNVACGGQPGVSDTFASALWALDYLVRAMGAGIEGVNLHGDFARPAGYAPLAPATPIDRAAGRLQAEPEWYALLAASQLRGDRVASVTHAPAGLPGSLTVLERPDGGEDIVVVDLASPDTRPQTVRVSLPPGFRSGTVLHLTAPSPMARSGVTLGGRAVSPSGQWRPKVPLPAVPVQGTSASVNVAPSSAVVISLHVRR
jgi:hypothetical protein